MSGRWSTRLACAVMAIVMISPIAVAADDGHPPGEDVVEPRSVGPGDERNPAVAYNSNADQYLAVWEDGRHYSTRGTDIYGQRLAADGSRIGGAFRISGILATSSEYNPAVAYNATANQYLIVWEDYRDSGTRGSDIYGRRVKAGGRLAGDDFRISGAAADEDEYSPAVAYNATANQYLVAWADFRDSGTRGSDIYGKRVKAGGRLAGDDFRISGDNATSGDNTPAVAYNGKTSQYLVVWQDNRSFATRQSDTYGRRVKAGGRLAGGDFRICEAAATLGEYNPAVAYDPGTDQFLAVWSDYRSAGARGADVYARLIAGGGGLTGDDVRVSGANATGYDTFPAVAFGAGNSEYMVVWQDARAYATRGDDIFGRRIGAGGSKVGSDFWIMPVYVTPDP